MSAIPPRHSTSLYRRNAVRGLETAATRSLGGDGYALMSRAGEAAWQALRERWPRAGRVAVACGPGNNGGDGYVLALRALQSGRDAVVVQLDGHAPGTRLAARARDAWVAAGGRIAMEGVRLAEADVVVDALFGLGLSRPLDAGAAGLVEAINAAGVPVLALDAPSGVDTETGAVAGPAVRADATIQFLAAHAGLHTGAAVDHVGELLLAGLDLPPALFDGVEPAAACLRPADLEGRFPPRARSAHKGSSGYVLCIGGDQGTGGAVLLAAEAALRCGAGLVGVATRPAHIGAALARRPELMVHGVEGAAGLRPLLERADVVVAGPGLGQAAWGSALFRVALASGKSLVLDADALNLLARSGGRLAGHRAILTPHPGEAARLLGVTAGQVQADRFAAARRLQERFGCVVVLKGAGTVVAAPGALPQLIAAGNPGMATGGTGDVLAGVIAALAAQGHAPGDAAATGALLHAVAGDAAAHAGGERGMCASDLFAPLRELVNG